MKIAQISDLHFGCLNDEVKTALLRHLHDDVPDLIIASGDLTQSATDGEFEAARDFLAELPARVLSIPGNHDLPGMDITRFLHPWRRYRRYIAEEMNPQWSSPLVAIKGLNSARMILPHWNWANGAISDRQCRAVEATFAATTAPWRMVVAHHPLIASPDFPLAVTVFNGRALLDTLAQQKVDLVLAGHQHHAYIETREMGGHTTLFVNASTATSTRLRRQPNGFNRLTFSPEAVRIDLLRYQDGAFSVFEAVTHSKSA
ncbi:metallophosphoesterase [Asticcacaulis sp. EMRT-3]|uniref:metallophosphoesterase family protein n=1 Tax=Asticcacaulis sp. EMRT-3 TaxID=3040349 RepID=UPI0024AEA581|nr:metallophosphoesterase [Asticcacaulis sp. EMRT-3]MDI7776414.1 metallophosphoesterase [Asticcacaulis sp. EMRT-3]